MDTFRKIITALCAVLFTVSGILALFAINLERQAFDSLAYKQAFEKQNLYERVPGILANALHDVAANDPNVDPYLKALTLENWQAIIATLLPPQELKAVTDSALDSIFEYANGRSNSAVLPLTTLKSNLLGPAGLEIARQILQSQPACTAQQLLEMGLGFVSGNVTLCNPPPEMLELVKPLIETQLRAMTLSIPDEVTLISSAPGDPAADPRVRLNQARTWLKILPVFPPLFLFALTVFGVRSLLDWLIWWGGPFAIMGGIGSLIAILGAPILGLAVEYLLQSQGAGLIPPILLSTVRESISTVIGQILQPVLTQSLVLFVLGVVMVTTSLWLAKRKHSAM